MPRLVVVGGGISGLAAAWSASEAARKAGAGLEVVVLERADDVGGKARSVVRDGWLAEGGPGGFFRGRPELDALITAAGLEADVVAARPASKRRFIFHGGRMRRVAPSPAALTTLLGVTGTLRLAADVLVPRGTGGDDESVWAFAARRIGRRAADRMVAPMCLGIFAGDARRLSLASAFPRMAALERDHGGLLRGLVAKRGKMSSGALSSFRRGMQSLPRALAAHGTFTVRTRADVRAIDRNDGTWRVTLADGGLAADAVIVAAEPWTAARLVAPLSANAGEALAAIPCPPVSVVALGYDADAGRRIPDGFGVLVARGEGIRMLGNVWESSLYPGRGPDGGTLIRAFLGGATDTEIGGLDDAATVALVRAEVERIYGVTAAPTFTSVVRIPHAIPQYEIGHRRLVAAVEGAVAGLPGLGITGNGLRGVAFADAAADGVRTGARLAAALLSGKDLRNGVETGDSVTSPVVRA